MRILFISAFYPPYVVGGWEQLVQDIQTHLQSRGHITRVLTSTYGAGATPLQQRDIKRVLQLDSDLVNYSPVDFFLHYDRRLDHNLEVTREAIRSFQPDVVFIHVMWNLTRGVPWLAEQLCPGRVVYYIANNWPYAPSPHRAYWTDSARSAPRKLLKRLLAPVALRRIAREETGFPLQFEKVLCVSQAIRQDLACNALIPLENMQVVYNGVEVDRFVPLNGNRSHPAPDGIVQARPNSKKLALLYAGSLVPHKGVHTAVEAMGLLAQMGTLDEGFTLTIVGSGHPDYEAGLRRRVAENGLEQRVFFWPRVSREEMPALLQKFDVLVFPSLWEEPLARMMQEAMASGLVVVGTPTGGTPEILVDGKNGLTFEPGNAQELAGLLLRLRDEPGLRSALAHRARQAVIERFDLDRMIVEIEDALSQVVLGDATPKAQWIPE